MKINPVLQDVYKGEWLLDAHSILSYAPILSKILAGEEVIFENSQASILTIQDSKGRFVPKDEDGYFEEIPKGSVAHVYMIGPVIKRGDICTYGADEIVSALRFANLHENIKGIIFHIDGPGGSVAAIGPFLQFAKEKRKPVIGLIDSAYSLHYWTAVAVCDRIYADNDVSAGVGSVGVVLSFVDTRPVMEERGYKFHDIYPEESKHKNEAFNLAREGKYDQIKEEMLAPTARKFQAAVKSGRPGLIEVTGVLTGKTFRVDEGLKYKMLDGVKSIEECIQMIDLVAEQKSLII